MPPPALTAASLVPHLKLCKYVDAQLATDYNFGGGQVPLAAFADTPHDARSACIAVVDSVGDSAADVQAVRETGAPVVLACKPNRMEWWKQTTTTPEHKDGATVGELPRFFEIHKTDFAPATIYEGKTRRRLPGQIQLHFVDVGLMPMVERSAGDALSRLVERVIRGMEKSLGKQIRTKADIESVFKSAFWLLAAKMLHDKQVKDFKTIKLGEIDDVFRRVGSHYGDTQGLPPGGKAWRASIEEAAATIDQFAYLGNVSTEALAYLYENALVPDEVRAALGTHSTPSALVDYMVWQLWPWIEAIPEDDRYVFEPACGHGAFLVGMLRQLRQWSSITDGKDRHEYLKERLRGVECDAFALEIAKLSLTLADVPHGNTWKLRQGDMYLGDTLERESRRARILLANPPFEKFTAPERRDYKGESVKLTAQTKPVEMMLRTLPHLAKTAVFGLVVPQRVLHSKEATGIRRTLADDFELAEVSIFADNLFQKSKHEVAILLGRRKPAKVTPTYVTYRTVRRENMAQFRENFAFSSQQPVAPARLAVAPGFDWRIRELDEVWSYLSRSETLEDLAFVQKGFEFKSEEELHGQAVQSDKPKAGWLQGFLRAEGGFGIWQQPPLVWLNYSKRLLRRVGASHKPGVPQVLANYAPSIPGPWLIKATLDPDGRPVTSRFVTVRRRLNAPPPEFFWAVMNSPVANAFAATWPDKRQTLVKDWRKLPVPKSSPQRASAIVQAAKAFLALMLKVDEPMAAVPSNAEIRKALLRIDAEVLRLYDLPPRLERQLLDLFAGVERKGVGCAFLGYYPPDLDAFVPLHELISDDYARSLLGVFRARHRPERSGPILGALRRASETFAED